MLKDEENNGRLYGEEEEIGGIFGCVRFGSLFFVLVGGCCFGRVGGFVGVDIWFLGVSIGLFKFWLYVVIYLYKDCCFFFNRI